MRSLLTLWLLCLSLALPVTSDDCDFKMPTGKQCEQKINYRVYSHEEATATCRDFFPTNFVTGTREADNVTVKCIVDRMFECSFLPNSFLMHDKCYTFSKPEVTMVDYTSTRSTLCKDGGGLPIFFSMSQAKFVAMEAHRQGINKMWVNVDRNGKTIEKAQDLEEGFLLYANPWKVYEDKYWDGESLKSNPNVNDKGASAKTDHLFFRTRTDYEHNLMQGSFERANGNTKASVVCEYVAKIIPEQGWYCDKMGAQGLGISARYDRSLKRCVYVTMTKYAMEGSPEAIKNFKGCRERPSTEQATGLDDGTASKKIYEKLTEDGIYRVAAIKMDTKSNAFSQKYMGNLRGHCNTKKSFTTAEQFYMIRQPYQLIDYFSGKTFSNRMQCDWQEGYPKDECSDFGEQNTKMHSNALAIKRGKIIDIPTAVRARALCSIASNVPCGLKNPCRSDQLCESTNEWQEKTNGYTKCTCPEGHEKDSSPCKWIGQDKNCGKMRNVKSKEWREIPKGVTDIKEIGKPDWNDLVDRVVVRKGCKMSVWSHYKNRAETDNYELLPVKEVGEYEIPCAKAGTLNGWDQAMGASSIRCSCP